LLNCFGHFKVSNLNAFKNWISWLLSATKSNNWVPLCSINFCLSFLVHFCS
jgi:hypothetical protein